MQAGGQQSPGQGVCRPQSPMCLPGWSGRRAASTQGHLRQAGPRHVNTAPSLPGALGAAPGGNNLEQPASAERTTKGDGHIRFLLLPHKAGPPHLVPLCFLGEELKHQPSSLLFTPPSHSLVQEESRLTPDWVTT